MAITFEEQDNSSGLKIAIISLVVVIVLAGFGFLVWRLLSLKPAAAVTPHAEKIKIDTGVLSDPRLTSLELFPEIPPATVTVVRQNPFVEDDGTMQKIEELAKQNAENNKVDSVNNIKQP